MKNIHVIPTDKPSRLHLWSDENGTRLETCELEYSHTRNTQNIYITSDEEIKEGDWCLSKLNELVLFKSKNFNYKKIILTTDQDLIKNGVQEIDDEFLEWFVKNPTCEFVETFYSDKDLEGYWKGIEQYQIIIPKEEPKQENAKIFIDATIKHSEPNEKLKKVFREHGKQETLEEVAETHAFNFYEKEDRVIGKQSFIEGAKYEKQNSDKKYSEEEVVTFLHNVIGQYGKHYGIMIDGGMLDDLFEKFKK